MKMKKSRVIASALLIAIACSASAFASLHHYQVIGEGIGHTSDEAYDAAAYDSARKCYLSWGRSTQEVTILVQQIQPETGYWYAKVSEGCISED